MQVQPAQPEKRRGSSRRLTLAMADEDVVRRFHAVVGAGTVRRDDSHHRANPAHAVMWRWSCGRWRDVERILLAFLPMLGARRRVQAEQLLAQPAELRHWNSRKTHCKRGHPLSGPNLMVAGGRRRCRACKRLSSQS